MEQRHENRPCPGHRLRRPVCNPRRHRLTANRYARTARRNDSGRHRQRGKSATCLPLALSRRGPGSRRNIPDEETNDRGKIIMKAIIVTDQAAGTSGMKLAERPEPQAAINEVVV